MKTICIVGTGGFAREVLCLLDALDRYEDMDAFLEPDSIWEEKWKGKTIMGKRVMPMSYAQPDQHQISIGIASGEIRRKTLDQLPEHIEHISLIHPSAQVSRWVRLGEGSIVTAGCILTSEIEIGNFAHLNLNTTVGHNSTIGDFFTTAPGVNISGNCSIASNVYMGAGSGTKQGITICENVIIGMGAMVVSDIQEPGTYIGIPAKRMIKG
jgi:sugar O-acyltransferase (sialic acid O-acetyltransferase NeuD family)